jgi:hypothetical protein
VWFIKTLFIKMFNNLAGWLALWLWWVRHDYACAALGPSESFNALMNQGI